MMLAAAGASALAGARNPEVVFETFQYQGVDHSTPAVLPPSTYRNPILAGFYPDPSLCRVGDDYYLINSTFAYFPGIPVFHSRDLVNWRQIGNVIHRPSQLTYDKLGSSRGIFAPAISYHDGVYYVVCTMADAGGNFVVTATNPAGPWSDPVWLPVEGIDPSLFFDDDGKCWLLNNGAPEGKPLYPGHRAIWLQQFDVKQKKMVGPRKVLVNGGVDISQKPVWIEGPHLFRRGDWLYLCCAEGGTSVNHSQVIFRSRSVDEPFTPWEKNPILTQRNLDGCAPHAVTSTGHAELVIGPDNQWWAVFLGVRPYEKDYSPMGRETFLLPVTWTADGWPTILTPGDRVPLTGSSPNHARLLPQSESFLNGSFTWSADFTSTTLSPEWMMLRTPKETWWKIDPRARTLTLTAGKDTLYSNGNPSYLGRRVQHSEFSTTTSLLTPTSIGTSGGLAVFQGERYHYYLAIRRDEKDCAIYLERSHGGQPEVVAEAHVQTPEKVSLRVEADGPKCAFAFSVEPNKWQTLATDCDAKLLTTAVAGGFIGATVGPHARLDR